MKKAPPIAAVAYEPCPAVIFDKMTLVHGRIRRSEAIPTADPVWAGRTQLAFTPRNLAALFERAERHQRRERRERAN